MPKQRNRTGKTTRAFSMNLNTGGVDEDSGVFTIPITSAESINNLHFAKNAEYTYTNTGYTNLQTVAGTTPRSLGAFKSADGEDILLVQYDDKLATYNTTTATYTADVSASSMGTAKNSYTQFKGRAVLCNSSRQPAEFIAPSTFANISGFPIDGTYSHPRFATVYSNRVVYGNFTNHESTIVLSETETINGFSLGLTPTSATALAVSPGDGEDIVGLGVVYSPSREATYLVIFKTSSIYVLSGNTPDTYLLTRMDGRYSALGHDAIEQVGTELLFASLNNVYSLSAAATVSGNVQPVIISGSRIKDSYQAVNLAYRDSVLLNFIPFRNELWSSIPVGATAAANKTLVGKLRENTYVWSTKDGFSPVGLITTTLNKTYSFNSDLMLVEWFGASTYAGAAYPWEYAFPYTDFGSIHQNKRILNMEAWFKSNGNVPFSVTGEWQSSKGTRTFKAFSTAVASASIYGTTLYGGAVYGERTSYYKVKVPMFGNGQQLKLTIEGTSSGSSRLSFLGFTGLVEYGDFSRTHI